ncbi:hypothetical protein NDU88_003426 [Pleurodeles waltl]|uniref:Uncharacterized protein n=1 Tax=Pleurodeles waltl TaxID=8319 RepID=A0AAV7RCU6_PLEWA|nr:hypothetical protein NDU88_003426 [Pleurodeles waltl]
MVIRVQSLVPRKFQREIVVLALTEVSCDGADDGGGVLGVCITGFPRLLGSTCIEKNKKSIGLSGSTCVEKNKKSIGLRGDSADYRWVNHDAPLADSATIMSSLACASLGDLWVRAWLTRPKYI